METREPQIVVVVGVPGEDGISVGVLAAGVPPVLGFLENFVF